MEEVIILRMSQEGSPLVSGELFVGMRLSIRQKTPFPGGQLKYLTPLNVPSVVPLPESSYIIIEMRD